MTRMTGGQALMKSLAAEGVKVIFGLPGVQIYHAVDALHDVPEIRFITTRHEQTTAYMADGYSRASGEIGTALVVPGPGLLNASAAIGTAFASSSPVMVVAGQIPRDVLGVNRGVLRHIERPLTSYHDRLLGCLLIEIGQRKDTIPAELRIILEHVVDRGADALVFLDLADLELRLPIDPVKDLAEVHNLPAVW